jgi:hypothetical protein
MTSHLSDAQRPRGKLAGGHGFPWSVDHAVRVYHYDDRCPTATTRRMFGPLLRFDPHRPSGSGALDPDRAVAYYGESITTAIREVFVRGTPEVSVCPNHRAAIVRPVANAVDLQDFVGVSPSEMGAPDDLGDGDWAREDTQQWAREIHRQRPAGPSTSGIRYWSRKDRDAVGGRKGVSRVVWENAPELRVVDRRGGQEDWSLHTPPLWRRLLVDLGDVGVVPRPITPNDCGSCRGAALRMAP